MTRIETRIYTAQLAHDAGAKLLEAAKITLKNEVEFLDTLDGMNAITDSCDTIRRTVAHIRELAQGQDFLGEKIDDLKILHSVYESEGAREIARIIDAVEAVVDEEVGS